jgi:TolB-like protein/Flp pilus assembly protein TadD
MNLISELKRRNVFRVAAGYVVVGWLLMQVADTFFPALNLPAWTTTLVAALLVLGFPLAIFMAWAFEMTPEGIKRDTGELSAVNSGFKAVDGITIALLLGVLIFMGWQSMAPPDAQPQVVEAPATKPLDASVAVLPFVNMSADPDNEYFSDGLTETLLHMLAQVDALKVAARTSSFAFKGSDRDVRKIAEQLGVAAVLEGSVQRSGDQVRITAQLIQASDGFHLWSQVYDRDLTDIFAVQDEIAQAVASALQGSLLGVDEAASLSDGMTTNQDAYDHYLRGREELQKETERSLINAERLFRRVLALDPDFALAWSALARNLALLGSTQGTAWIDVRDEIFACAGRGVELAPNIAETHVVLGAVHYYDGDMTGSRAALQRALELQPGYARALSSLGDAVFRQGDFDEAAELAERAMAADPLDFELKSNSTYKLNAVGRKADAIALAEAVLKRQPDSIDGLSALANTYWRTGEESKAIPLYMRMVEINPNQRAVMMRIAQSYHDLGDLEAANLWLRRAYENNPSATEDDMARFCFLSGDLECAIAHAKQRLAAELTEGRRLRAEADLARYQENWSELLDVSLKRLERYEADGGSINSSEIALHVALAADRLGDTDTRDRLVKETIDEVQQQITAGDRTHYGVTRLASAHALMGDAESAAKSLAVAFERGFRDTVTIRSGGMFDAVLDNPEIMALITDQEADNARELEAAREAIAVVHAD